MYTDYTVDDVLESVSCFLQNLSNTAEELKERREMLETAHLNIMDQRSKQDLSQTTEKLIGDECGKQEFFITNVTQNKVNIGNLESTVLQLRALQAEKESQCSDLEANVDALRNEFNSRMNEKEKIKQRRSELLTYMILTNIDLIYTTKNVKGVAWKEVPRTFHFDPEKFSQEEITKMLWDLILEK